MPTRPFIHLVKTPLHFYFYEVNKNVLVRIEEKLYDYLKHVLSDSQVGRQMDPEMEEKMDQLKKQGYLSTDRPSKIEHPYLKSLSYHLSHNIAQMTLQLTQNCNFRCAYCVYGGSDLGTQRGHSSKRMDLETAYACIDFFREHSRDQEMVCIGFYGGEPLLELATIKQLIPYAKKCFEGKKVTFTITTNGSLLTKEVAKYLHDHDVSIVVSLDGPKEIQDRSRRFASNGRGTFETVRKNLEEIQQEYPEVYQGVIVNTVVDPRNQVELIHDLFNHDPLFKDLSAHTSMVGTDYSMEQVAVTDKFTIGENKEQFKAYMSLLGRYPKKKVSRLTVSSIMTQMDLFLKDMGKKRIFPTMAPGGPCIPGQKRLFVASDGTFFPCERVSETSQAMKIGDIKTGFDLQAAEKLLNIGTLTQEECKDCWAIANCMICARQCDNGGELSKEFKRSHCRDTKRQVHENLLNYLLIRELQEEMHERERSGGCACVQQSRCISL